MSNLNLEKAIEQMFDFSSYSLEEKKSVIFETANMIAETTLLRSLDEAGEGVQEKFANFIELDPSREMIIKFITKHLPNYEKILIEELEIFKNMGNQ